MCVSMCEYVGMMNAGARGSQRHPISNATGAVLARDWEPPAASAEKMLRVFCKRCSHS